ncbi:Soluble lytic murein transglycosylase [Enhydrobacter aerosaccus]|uniref:Soluble lytic murein transglycosylase n=1 Tax=Enhydrobacter aerosaccus TaxID=225324 RepID=A0A1T4NP47_9HYPH|nr:lytic transglycosylase domain-containing protein [Enhydrobacter aerosaccus]SJZ80983.1 Soluble lytic murein transglycosylase [Enhydrobacter aerosaccus]
MKQLFPAAVLAAVTGLAASALAQTATTPPHRPAPAVKPTKAAAHVPAHAGFQPASRAVVHRPVFVPPPPVIELDEVAVNPDLPTVLDAETRDRYRRIFQEQAAGHWAEADAEIAKLTDKTLLGYVGAQRLLASNYQARYEQFAAWLQDYNDHPDAPAIYRLALAKRPRGASDELTPATFVTQAQSSPAFAAARTVTGADAADAAALRTRLQQMADDGGFNAAFALLDRKSTVDLLGPQEAELWRGRIRTRALEADSQRSMQVPVEVSLPPDANWSAGLAAFTSGNMPEAARRFEMVADAPPDQASSWTLSAGAFWAARANLLAGNPQKFAPYLKRAALHNRTFYGLIAQKALGMKIVADWNLPPIERKEADILRNDRAGRRALALLQLGASTAAQRELFGASLDADPQYIATILSLANKAVMPALSVRVANAAWDMRHKIPGYDAAAYPQPPWQPASGYSVDRALLWGFMRQESAFNPKARSVVGAMGLLQLMPQTARIVSSKYALEAEGGNPFDPSVNISLGQAYIGSLLGSVDDNLVRTAAAYNGGPGNVFRWDTSLNASADPLLYVASIPLDETRDFVQRVLANYWMYQIRLGQPTPSLDQIAAHEWPRYVPQDTGR